MQLNLPVTSVRDFEIYNDDLIVATHGRGFWVIDDISPLRQINEAVLASNAFLFKPADAINYAQGGDNGTPLQKDEPQALNPPNGAVIDYYLKTAATGPVVLEILDASGATVATFATENTSQPTLLGGRGGGAGGRGGGIPNTSALWRPTPEPFSGRAGDAPRRVESGRGRRRPRWSWRRWGAWRRWRAADRNVHGEADREWSDAHADLRRQARDRSTRSLAAAVVIAIRSSLSERSDEAFSFEL